MLGIDDGLGDRTPTVTECIQRMEDEFERNRTYEGIDRPYTDFRDALREVLVARARENGPPTPSLYHTLEKRSGGIVYSNTMGASIDLEQRFVGVDDGLWGHIDTELQGMCKVNDHLVAQNHEGIVLVRTWKDVEPRLDNIPDYLAALDEHMSMGKLVSGAKEEQSRLMDEEFRRIVAKSKEALGV